MQEQLSATPGVLTVELDIRHSAEGETPPAPLPRDHAQELGRAMAGDLARMLGSLDAYGLVTLGGLYDMTELLRPGLPMVDILMDLYLRSLPDSRFQPSLMTIGMDGDDFPVPAIAPARQPGAGPLFAIPFLFLGTRESIDRLSGEMEKTLLEKGKASMTTGEIITRCFGVRPVNLSYATLNDLCALLRIQLEHNDFGDLWKLLEASLFPDGNVHRVELAEGNHFLLRDTTCFAAFPGFRDWAAAYQGESTLEDAWGEWHRKQRQYTAGMLAHGIEVRAVPGQAGAALGRSDPDQAWGEAAMSALPGDAATLREVIAGSEAFGDARRISLTEHRLPALGPVAYTILVEGPRGETLAQINEYPLRPEAVREIPAAWAETARGLGIELEVSQPGRLTHRRRPAALLPAEESGDSVPH